MVYWGSVYRLGRAIHISCNHANEPSASDPRCDLASGETRALLEKWGKLHAVRTVLGLLASGIYVIELLKA